MNLLELATMAGVEGFMHCEEVNQLALLAAGKDVLELGSFKGLSAWAMALAARHVTCVDTFCANSAGQKQESGVTTYNDFVRATRRFNNVTTYIGDSHTVEVPGDFDFIFVDAMHTYEDVKMDTERWWRRLRPNGVMAFHDYGHHDFPGVQRAVDEFFGSTKAGGQVVTLRWFPRSA